MGGCELTQKYKKMAKMQTNFYFFFQKFFDQNFDFLMTKKAKSSKNSNNSKNSKNSKNKQKIAKNSKNAKNGKNANKIFWFFFEIFYESSTFFLTFFMVFNIYEN